MRIITGEARGLVLSPPPKPVRPTMDRVRAAIFSSLGNAVPGAQILDLFAGSGAMGIEALSRGAKSVIFVDIRPECAACIRNNLKKSHFEASVQTMDALRFLDFYAAPDTFNLIFADPPYAKASNDRNFSSELLQHTRLASSLRSGGLFILERLSGTKEPVTSSLALLRVRQYGESEVAYYTRGS